MEKRNNKSYEEQSSFLGKFVDANRPYFLAGTAGLIVAVAYYIRAWRYDEKVEKEEEIKKDYPKVYNLWRYHSWWAQMKKSRFEVVMKAPLELFITKELIPQLYFNSSVADNVRDQLSKSGYINKIQDNSVIGKVIAGLSETAHINVSPPQRLINRIFKLFVPREGYITKQEFVTKFLMVSNAMKYQDQLLKAIFDMIDDENRGYITFPAIEEITEEIAEMIAEFAPRLLQEIKTQIRDLIIKKIYEKFDQYEPLQDIPVDKFTVVTSEFSHKNLSMDLNQMLIPKSLEELDKIFHQISKRRTVNDREINVLDFNDFKSSMNQIFNFEAIAEKVVSYVFGGEKNVVFSGIKNDAFESIKQSSEKLTSIIWELINSDGDDYITKREFDSFFEFFYPAREEDEEDDVPIQESDKQNEFDLLKKSAKITFIAKNSGPNFGTSHRLTRILQSKNSNHISGKKLDVFVNSVLSFVTSIFETIARSATSKASVEKNVRSWLKSQFEGENVQDLQINFATFKEKYGDVIFFNISRFMSKMK